jgi:hypothetical protein
MSMYISPTKNDVCRLIIESNKDFEVAIGSGIPQYLIVLKEATYVVFPLIVDRERESKYRAANKSKGYAPEMQMQFLVRGEVIFEVKDKAAFLEYIAAFKWP